MNEHSSELDQLLELMADERLSPEQQARLQELLQADELARRQYLDLASLGAHLEWQFGKPAAEPGVTSSFAKVTPRSRSRVVGVAAAFAAGATAVAVLLSGLGILQLRGVNSLPPLATSNDPPAKAPEVVATLTGLVDCEWADEQAPPTYGEPLQAGRHLLIESGLAQLTFESGAQLILQGPVDFELQSDMEAELDRGKLSAIVPEQAHGFTVRTPSAEVVDLGTEFGLSVDSEGLTEVHVFAGEVLSWAVNALGNVEGEALPLTEHQGVRYSLENGPQELRADASRFVRKVSPRIAERQLPRLPVKHDLVLWLAADVLVKKDANNRVVAWQDILVGDNQLEDDAMQHFEEAQPRWVEDAIGGKPALRFDGESSYLVTTPFLTTPDQTVFLVFATAGRPDDSRKKHQLINYNGPPGDLPSEMRQFRVLQIDDVDTPGMYRALVYAGMGERWANFGLLTAKEPAVVGQPVVLGYLYDPDASHAELWVDGVSQGTTTAPPGLEFASRKIIGKHPRELAYFNGDIAELIIYNGALSEREIARVHRYLTRKYSIPSAVDE